MSASSEPGQPQGSGSQVVELHPPAVDEVLIDCRLTDGRTDGRTDGTAQTRPDPTRPATQGCSLSFGYLRSIPLCVEVAQLP